MSDKDWPVDKIMYETQHYLKIWKKLRASNRGKLTTAKYYSSSHLFSLLIFSLANMQAFYHGNEAVMYWLETPVVSWGNY